MIEKRYIRSNGSLAYARLVSTPVRSPEGTIEGVVRIVEDVTAQREAEAAEQATRRLLSALIEQIPALIFIKDIAGRYLLVNHAFAAISDHTPEQMIGHCDEELIDPDEAQMYAEQNATVIAARIPLSYEGTHSIDGELHTFTSIKFPLYNSAGEPYALGGVAIDVTTQKQVEAERRTIELRLRETQKLESLGLMAGGIAHDFNNLLVAVLGNASLALDELADTSAIRESLQQIELAARRAADLTRQLLAYAGKGRLSTRAVQVNTLIQEMTSLLRTSLPRSVQLQCELSHDVPLIEADPTQIGQVIMNLVINGGEAIGERRGSVTVRSELVHVDADSLAHFYLAPELRPGPYVRIAVRDTGSGIDAEVQQRIFEPFFSTKFTGRGLGLAAVLGIVRGHGGTITVYSEPGRGSVFQVLLPVEEVTSDTEATPALASVGGLKGTILLVDDEIEVRTVTRRMLERLGLQVHEAADSGAALELAAQHHADIPIALMDITMPDVGGEALAGALLASYPQIRILLMSGYSEDVISKPGAQHIHGFLAKPFVLHELAAAIDDILRRDG
ncbi:MAG: PAS domain-containing protein [Oscillochloris sp.]|nr:PAS domain-containing protein [Oscillochloris sp.]